MHWLEIIELRLTEKDYQHIQAEIQMLIQEIRKEIQKNFVTVYSYTKVNTDMSIHLLHNSETVEDDGSTLGLHLVSALKQFGLINHTVWIEIFYEDK